MTLFSVGGRLFKPFLVISFYLLTLLLWNSFFLLHTTEVLKLVFAFGEHTGGEEFLDIST